MNSECYSITEKIIAKAKILNTITYIENYDKTQSYLIKTGENEHTVIIKPETKILNGGLTNTGITDMSFTKNLYKLRGKLILYGGEGLVTTEMMLYNLNLDEVDLTNLNLQNVETAKYMFNSTHIKRINMRNVNMNKVRDMDRTFEGAEIDELVLDNIKIDSLRILSKTFLNADIGKLDLSKVDLSKIVSLYRCFEMCGIKDLSFGNNKLSNLEVCDSCFKYFDSPLIDLSAWRVPALKHCREMFYNCSAKVITKNIRFQLELHRR